MSESVLYLNFKKLKLSDFPCDLLMSGFTKILGLDHRINESRNKCILAESQKSKTVDFRFTSTSKQKRMPIPYYYPWSRLMYE